MHFADGAIAQQAYPSRTVKFIMPFGAASASDITARLFADRLSARWGKPVVVENRPGGDGIVSVQAFVSAADDHTLWFGPAGILTVAPYDHDTLPYDAKRDLLPIVSVSSVDAGVEIASTTECTLRRCFSCGVAMSAEDEVCAEIGCTSATCTRNNARNARTVRFIGWPLV